MLTALAASERRQRRLQVRRERLPDQSFNDTNYWVDATFDRTIPPDTRGPAVTDTTPPASASDVDRNADVTATFDEQVNAGDADDRDVHAARRRRQPLVPPTVNYDAQTRTATLNPTAPLAYQSDYTVTLKGGAGGVADAPATRCRRQDVDLHVAGQSPSEGPGGPILVLTDPADEFGTYYAEILRSEGLNTSPSPTARSPPPS